MWHPVHLALIFAAKYTQVEALYTYIILFETFIGSSKYEMATRQLPPWPLQCFHKRNLAMWTSKSKALQW